MKGACEAAFTVAGGGLPALSRLWKMTVSRMLYVVVCAAGPAGQVGTLITAAQDQRWQVQTVATPAARSFIDEAALAEQTGRPVLSEYRSPRDPRRSPPVDGVVVAPATFNTINKLAAGIADNYALSVLAECIGSGVPVVVLPFINSALAARVPLRASVAALRAEGVRVLLGPGDFEPHPPRSSDARVADFPWTLALSEITLAVRERAA